MRGSLIFLWHMHQPDYRQPGVQGEVYTEPWVYLHALKDYADMAWHLERQPAVRAVVNFSSVLIEQLDDYAQQFARGTLRDPLLEALARAELPRDPQQRRALGMQCLRLKRETMVRPYAAFAALEQRCAAADDGDESVFETLDEPSFADLLTWYHLAWCGASLKRSEPLVQRLMAQGRGFAPADRAALYDLVGHVVSGILPRYRQLAERGQVELSVTPHGHPIGPLLMDFRVAAGEGEQEATLPRAERYPGGAERARWHVEQAQCIFGRVFGRPPAGLWPAEAAVSAEFLHLLGGMGLDWAAMDGVSLQRSLGHEGGAVPPASWRLEGSAGPRLFVRDTPLSEFLSFEYSRRAPADAVRHLLDGVAERLRQPAPAGPPVVCLMLDGENAWEHYPDNACDFFTALYAGVAAEVRFETTTPARYLAEHGAASAAPLAHLSQGSWAGGGFGMWIGDERRNAAWDALCTLKRAFDAAAPALPDEARRQAERALGRCESSDWYWWMGFDEPVPAVLRFDAAFREALLAVYTAIGRPAPDDLPGTFSRLGHSLHGPVSMQDLAHAIAQAIGMEITVPVPEGELNWNSHQPVAPGSPLAAFLAAQQAVGWLFVVPAIELPGAHRPAAFKYAEIRIALEKANQRFFEGRARLVNGDMHPGLLVIGVDREQARRVVERFGVVGGVWGERMGRGEVLVVAGGRAGAGGKA